MKRIIRNYLRKPLEQKIIINTIVGLCCSSVLICGKFVIGLLGDYNLCVVAVYSAALLLAKLYCVRGALSDAGKFANKNSGVAAFVLAASVLYALFMSRLFFVKRQPKPTGIVYVAMVAFISFAEMGFAIAGILRTKNKGHFYRNIKIINFCIALTAILSTQITILDFTMTANVDFYNACAGVGIGAVIALCAVYIFIAPITSVIGREHNAFALKYPDRNRIADMSCPEFAVTLCASRVYGSYYYAARVQNNCVTGDIVRGKSLWRAMHPVVKAICCILSEILLPLWLVGRFAFFSRSVNLPARLQRIFENNGFVKLFE